MLKGYGALSAEALTIDAQDRMAVNPAGLVAEDSMWLGVVKVDDRIAEASKWRQDSEAD